LSSSTSRRSWLRSARRSSTSAIAASTVAVTDLASRPSRTAAGRGAGRAMGSSSSVSSLTTWFTLCRRAPHAAQAHITERVLRRVYESGSRWRSSYGVWVTHVVDLGACAECISLSVALERVATAAAHSQEGVGRQAAPGCVFSRSPSAPLPECHTHGPPGQYIRGAEVSPLCVCWDEQAMDGIAMEYSGVSSPVHGCHGWGT
jgi:hypothetical protein